MSVAEQNKTVYALSHAAPNSLASSGDFFLNELDAHAAKSRHRMGLEVFAFDAPQDDINEARVNGSLYDNVLHLEISERISLLKNTLGDDHQRVMARAELDFATEIEEQPANKRILADALTSALPPKQAARAMINYTPSLSRKLIAEHTKARSDINKFDAYYKPEAIMARSLDVRSQSFNDKAKQSIPNTEAARNAFENGRAAYYQSILAQSTECKNKLMTSASIGGKEYTVNVEFDYNNMSQEPNSVNGIEVGYMSLTGPIEYGEDGMLDIIEHPDLATYQVHDRDAKKLLASMDSSQDNPTLVAEMVNYARAMNKPKIGRAHV